MWGTAKCSKIHVIKLYHVLTLNRPESTLPLLLDYLLDHLLGGQKPGNASVLGPRPG